MRVYFYNPNSKVSVCDLIINWQLTGDIHEEVETHNRMLDRTVCITYLLGI